MDLRKYVVRNSKDRLTVAMLEAWTRAILRQKKLRKVHQNEVFPIVREIYEGDDVDLSRWKMKTRWDKLQKLIVNFFEKEIGRHVSRKVKEKLKMSSEDVLVYEVWRRRFAMWVLGPYLRRRAARAQLAMVG